MGSLADLGKGESDPNTVPLSQLGRYPTRDDVIMARNYDLSYGTSFAPFARYDATVGQVPIGDVPDMMNKEKGINPAKFQRPMDTNTADQLYAAWMAAQRSPVAALGFDPRRILTTPMPEPGKATLRLNVGGAYRPDEDVAWFDPRYPTSAVHESTHRGFKMLRDIGSEDTPGGKGLPFNAIEEPNVRAMMLRHYGPVEKGRGELVDKEVASAQSLLDRLPYQFPRMEAAAQAEIRRRDHKMGPR